MAVFNIQINCLFGLHVFGPVDDHGYQYCKTCGKAHQPKHNCVFELERENLVYGMNWGTRTELPIKTILVQKCIVCGKIIQTTIE